MNPKFLDLEVRDSSVCSLDHGRAAFSVLSINSVCGLSGFFHLDELLKSRAKDEICNNSSELSKSEMTRQDGWLDSSCDQWRGTEWLQRQTWIYGGVNHSLVLTTVKGGCKLHVVLSPWRTNLE